MAFLLESDKVKDVVSLCLSPNKKYLAAVERVVDTDAMQISIYNMQMEKRIRVLNLPGNTAALSRDILDCSFSGDNKYLATLLGPPDYYILIWRWYNLKVVAAVSHADHRSDGPLEKVTFNPWDFQTLCVSGPRALRILRYSKDDESLAYHGPNAIAGYREDASITDHVWLVGDRLAAASTASEVLVHDNQELKAVVRVPGRSAVTAVERLVRGFVVATARGDVILYDKVDVAHTQPRPSATPAAPDPYQGQALYTQTKVFNLGGDGGPAAATPGAASSTTGRIVRWIAVSPAEESLICGLDSSELALINLTVLEHASGAVGGGAGASHGNSIVRAPTPQGDSKSGEGSFTAATLLSGDHAASGLALVCNGFHHGPVVAMDVALQRPYLVSCGLDCTVRVWNYHTASCLLRKQMSDPVFSVSIHPSGFYVMVGCTDKLRLFHVLVNDLLLLKEFHVPLCKAVAFSHGGHLVAAANGTNIVLLNPYTFATVALLKGHISTVRCVRWSANDLKIVSAGMDGAVYEWRMDVLARDPGTEHVRKACPYSHAGYVTTTGAVIAVGNDGRQVQSIDNGAADYGFELTSGHITSLVLSRDDRLLLAGTTSGSLRMYGWQEMLSHAKGKAGHASLGALGGAGVQEKDPPYEEYRIHKAAITAVLQSPDKHFLFTASEDGSIFMFEVQYILDSVHDRAAANMVGPGGAIVPASAVTNSNSGAAQGDHRGLASALLSIQAAFTGAPGARTDVYLVAKEDLDEKQAALDELASRVREVASHAEYEKMLSENRWREQFARMTEDSNASMVLAEAARGEMQAAREQETAEWEARVNLLNSQHVQAAEALESLYERKLAAESARYDRLLAECKDARFQYEERASVAEAAHRHAMEEMMEHYQALLRAADSRYAKLHAEAVANERALQEYIRQQEKDTDAEMQAIEEHGTKALVALDVQRQGTRAENLLLQRKVTDLQKHFVRLEEAVKAKEAEVGKLNAELADARHSSGKLLQDLSERDKIIHDKEQAVASLKAKVKELEKLKYVLEVKMSELRREIAPRQAQLEDLKRQTEEVDSEMLKSMKTHAQLRGRLQDKEGRISSLEKELSQLRALIGRRETTIASFVHELMVLMQNTDARARNDALTRLYQKYCLVEDPMNPAGYAGSGAPHAGGGSGSHGPGGGGAHHGSPGGHTAAGARGGHSVTTQDLESMRNAAEMERQRGYVEVMSSVLRRRISNYDSRKVREDAKGREENSILLDENAQLRKENKQLQLRAGMLEERLSIAVTAAGGGGSAALAAGSIHHQGQFNQTGGPGRHGSANGHRSSSQGSPRVMSASNAGGPSVPSGARANSPRGGETRGGNAAHRSRTNSVSYAVNSDLDAAGSNNNDAAREDGSNQVGGGGASGSPTAHPGRASSLGSNAGSPRVSVSSGKGAREGRVSVSSGRGGVMASALQQRLSLNLDAVLASSVAENAGSGDGNGIGDGNGNAGAGQAGMMGVGGNTGGRVDGFDVGGMGVAPAGSKEGEGDMSKHQGGGRPSLAASMDDSRRPQSAATEVSRGGDRPASRRSVASGGVTARAANIIANSGKAGGGGGGGPVPPPARPSTGHLTPRGGVVHGSTARMASQLKLKELEKIQQLMEQLEDNQQEMKAQQFQIEALRGQVSARRYVPRTGNTPRGAGQAIPQGGGPYPGPGGAGAYPGVTPAFTNAALPPGGGNFGDPAKSPQPQRADNPAGGGRGGDENSSEDAFGAYGGSNPGGRGVAAHQAYGGKLGVRGVTGIGSSGRGSVGGGRSTVGASADLDKLAQALRNLPKMDDEPLVSMLGGAGKSGQRVSGSTTGGDKGSGGDREYAGVISEAWSYKEGDGDGEAK
eukprot:jgi/Mesvir1/27308/Mv07136-RA.1